MLNPLNSANRKATVALIATFITGLVYTSVPDLVEQAPWLEEAVTLALSYVVVWAIPNGSAS